MLKGRNNNACRHRRLHIKENNGGTTPRQLNEKKGKTALGWETSIILGGNLGLKREEATSGVE